MLSNEDKKDVSGAMGKALANKISKVTRDGGKKIYAHYSMNPAYMKLVRKNEGLGMTTSDAQGNADLKFDPHFAKKK